MIDVPFLKSVTLKKENIPSFSAYPYCLTRYSNITITPFHPNVTFIIGENGTGKSTLLEAIAVALGFNAEGGTKNFRFSTNDSHSSLHEYLRISKSFNTPNDGFFLRAESFYNVASYIDEIDAIKSYGWRFTTQTITRRIILLIIYESFFRTRFIHFR